MHRGRLARPHRSPERRLRAASERGHIARGWRRKQAQGDAAATLAMLSAALRRTRAATALVSHWRGHAARLWRGPVAETEGHATGAQPLDQAASSGGGDQLLASRLDEAALPGQADPNPAPPPPAPCEQPGPTSSPPDPASPPPAPCEQPNAASPPLEPCEAPDPASPPLEPREASDLASPPPAPCEPPSLASLPPMPSEELGPASPWAEPSAGQRERRNRAAHARRASRRALDTDAWSGGVAVDVAKSDVTPKESVWLARRSKVITETVQHGETNAVHIVEHNMVAGSNTNCIGGVEVRDHGAWRPEGRCGSRAVARPSPRRWNRARSRRCTSASATWS